MLTGLTGVSYHLVGGDFDQLFLDSPPASLSFVYTSLGCQHTLHQEKTFFEPPSIPALTAQGFVRWQVIQILLAPTEHVPYLQESVRRFEILNAGPGGPFPKVLPAECLPQTPDADITKWHKGVEQRLRLEAEASSRPKSARVGISSGDVPLEQAELNPASPRWRPHLRSSHSTTPRRESSSDARTGIRFPNSPHPLKNAQNYKKVSIVSGSSSSSSSSPSPPLRNAKLADPERSPRSCSLARHQYHVPKAATGRRHSAHAIHGNQSPPREVRNTLSPQFFAQNALRSTTPGNGSVPMDMDTSLPLVAKTSATVPQTRVRGHRHTVSHDRSKETTWRDRLSAYIGISGSVDGTGNSRIRRRGSSETRETDQDRRAREFSDDHRYTQGVRFVNGIGAIPLDRRLPSPKRGQRDEDREPRRRSRHERHRQRSGDDTSGERYYEGS